SLKNFILLYVDGQKIYYWLAHSNLYDDIYQGKYQILKYYFKQKLVKLEQDIFLRDNQDPQLFVYFPNKNYLHKNVIESSMEELILFRNAIKRYRQETPDDYLSFQNFVKNSSFYNEQEKKSILEEHFDFSLNSRDKNYYFEEITKTDFRGEYSEKARDDEKMFADLFDGEKLRS
ncbi:hypothetical protein ACXYXD_03280, partial [Mesomycoplasma ovipneumoniae]